MTLLLVGGSYAIAFVIGLLVGRTRQRVLALALGGVTVAGAVVAGYVLTAGCETLDCLVGAFFLAMFVVIWLAGVGAAALVRRADVTPEWRTLAAVGSALLVVVGTTLVLDRYANDVLRWGCGSWPEPHRSLPFREVIAAFAEAGLQLEPIATPPEVARPARTRAFRHRAPGATLYVVHCPEWCDTRLPPPDRPGHRYRARGLVGTDTIMWITDRGDRRASSRLYDSFPDDVTGETIDAGDRCYDP